MSYKDKALLRDLNNAPIPQLYDQSTDTFKPLQQMEYFGKTVTERPAISTVPVGAVYIAVQTQEAWQSDGVTWVVV